jgi:hypothetical protein
MANEHPEGKIHKLFVGINMKPYYEIGSINTVTNSKIVEIVFDTNHLKNYGIERYLIVSEDLTTHFKWTSAKPSGHPFIPQYAKPTGVPENIE